jgi:hypothetical protein
MMPPSCAGPTSRYDALIQDRGIGSTEVGQAATESELRARSSIWPPLRPTWMRCERESVVVVLPLTVRARSKGGKQCRGSLVSTSTVTLHKP